MIVYEIYIKVQVGLIQQFEIYMQEKHIPDMIKTGYFLGAEFKILSNGNYRVSYQVKNKAMLDEYLKKSAEQLREDFVKNFPEGVEVSREIIEG